MQNETKRSSVLGANIIDRLVKCPGSLYMAKRELSTEAKETSRPYVDVAYRAAALPRHDYAATNIETRLSTEVGNAVDWILKSILYNYALYEYSADWKQMLIDKFLPVEFDPEDCYNKFYEYYTTKVVEIDDEAFATKVRKYVDNGIDYLAAIYKANRRTIAVGDKTFSGKANMTAFYEYDMSKYNDNPNAQFALYGNPDFLFTDYETYAIMCDISTAKDDSRNKMFQMLICAYLHAINNKETNLRYMTVIIDTQHEDAWFCEFNHDTLIEVVGQILDSTLNIVHSIYSDHSLKAEDYRFKSEWCSYCMFRNDCKSCKVTSMNTNVKYIKLSEVANYNKASYLARRVRDFRESAAFKLLHDNEKAPTYIEVE